MTSEIRVDVDPLRAVFGRESRIFKDSRWLQPLSNPPGGRPLCRDGDLSILASYVVETLKSGQGRNIFIYGKPGTGKTLFVKYVLGEAKRYASEKGLAVLMVYVNAGQTRNPYYTMLELVRGMGVSVPEGGWQMFRLKQAFEKAKEGKSLLIAIDEVDAVLLKEREPLVYYLNRQPSVTLILISNSLEDATSLPERALSTLQPRLLGLEPYTAEEAKAILAERAAKAFQPSVLPEDFLDLAAKVVTVTGDVRDGFHILHQAGLLAEGDGSPRVEAEHLADAIESETAINRIKELEERIRKLRQSSRGLPRLPRL